MNRINIMFLNGIIGTPGSKTLYVADIGDNKTYQYSINVEGVTVFNKNGEQILHIPNHEDWTANVTFGGINNKTLFITAMGAAYTLKMNVKGAY